MTPTAWPRQPGFLLAAAVVAVSGCSTLSQRANADVTLELEVDPQLIGGVVARVGDLLLDGSVRTQLRQLGGTLRKGAA